MLTHSIQRLLAEAFLEQFPSAEVKKIDKDNYLDIHLPLVHPKRGTHFGFNTAGKTIKIVFYCREAEWVDQAVQNSRGLLEKYSQGVRLKGNPEFSDVNTALTATLTFIEVLLQKSGSPIPATMGDTETRAFNKAVNAYLMGDLDHVAAFVQAGNPLLQFNGDTLITNELISYVCAFTEVDQRIVDLVKAGVDLDASFGGGEGYTAVHFAAWDGKKEILSFLLAAGAQADLVGEDGYTPIFLAAAGGHLDCVKALVEKGVDVNRRLKDDNIYFSKQGGTPLTLCFINGFLEMALFLIDSGADPFVLREPCKNAPSPDLFVNFLSLVKQGQISAPAEVQLSKILKLVGLENAENLVVEDSELTDTHGSGRQLNLNEFLMEMGAVDDEKLPSEESKKDKVPEKPENSLDLTSFLEELELEVDSSDEETEEKETDADDSEQEKEEEGGYPMISFRNPASGMEDVVKQYLMRWQKPSQVYAWRLGIKAFIPEFVSKLASDRICPIFSAREIDAICTRIKSKKIIPILDYVPKDLYNYTKSVWWLVPFCIWKEDVASLVFVDKNGFYGMFSQNGEEAIQLIFNWENVCDLELEYELDDDPNVNRLTLYKEDGNYLTFDEFVSTSEKGDQGSYLSVIEAIWEIRKETIEASKGKPFWEEGAGGETFKVYSAPEELFQEDVYDKLKTITSSSNVIEFLDQNRNEIELDVAFGFLREDLKADHTILHYLLSNDQFIFKLFPESIKRDKNFILNWIYKTKVDLKEAEEAKKSNPESEEAVLLWEAKNKAAGFAPWILTQVDESLIGDENLLHEALTCKYVSFIKGLNIEKWNIDSKWAVDAAKLNIHSVEYLPKTLKNDPEVCKDLLAVHLSAYNFFEEEMKRNNDVQTFALRKDGNVFYIFPEDLKCNKAYIINMLEDCWDKDDMRGYMIFNTCKSLENDQELIDLAIERNSYIFESVISKADYSKEIFKYYLKVSPYIFRYVPDEWKDDRELILSLLSGGFDSQRRESIFSSSSWKDNKEFAKDLIALSDYSYSLKYLRKEFQCLPEIAALFLTKFSEPENIGILPAKELGLEFFRPILKENLNTLFFLNDTEIANTLFSENEKEALKLVEFSDLKLFDRMGILSSHPKVFRSVMRNPLINHRHIEYPPYDIQQDEELMLEIELLAKHLKNDCFNNRFNRNKDRNGTTFGEKIRARLDYIKSLNGTELEIFHLLLSDPNETVREEAAKRMQFTKEYVEQIVSEGIPLVTYYEYGKSKIINSHDCFVLRGIISNNRFNSLPESIKNEVITIEKETVPNPNSLKISFHGRGSEFVQGFISQAEYQQFIQFKAANSISDNGAAWLSFIENNNSKAEQNKENYWDYNDVSHFTGINLENLSIEISDENGQVIFIQDYNKLREDFEDSLLENNINVSNEYGKAIPSKLDDCLVTYLSNEKITLSFNLSPIIEFDPLKLGFVTVSTDEMGYATTDYGDFCLGIVYDGVKFDDPEFLSYGGSFDVYFIP